jgi:hypothetical protein
VVGRPGVAKCFAQLDIPVFSDLIRFLISSERATFLLSC